MTTADATPVTAEQIDAFEVAAPVRCTVLKVPRSEGARKTIERLMRQDRRNAKGLRRAQQLRMKRLNRYIRGNRLYTSREKAARVVQPRPGQSWQMALVPHIVPDLKSVAEYLRVERA